jgi:hypothetical protein
MARISSRRKRQAGGIRRKSGHNFPSGRAQAASGRQRVSGWVEIRLPATADAASE